jgi:hypothetical protein
VTHVRASVPAGNGVELLVNQDMETFWMQIGDLTVRLENGHLTVAIGPPHIADVILKIAADRPEES